MFRRDDEVKKGGDGARSKSSVVEEARKKREEREKKRHTERHAVALQAMVRGHHSRMSLLRQLRKDVDRKVRDIATLQQMLQKAFVIPTPVLLSIVHAALFATKLGGSSKATLDTEDASRLAQVIALLHSNWTLSGDSYPAAFGSMSTSPCHMLQHDLAWYRHLLAVLPAESYSAEPLAWLHVSASHSVPVVYPSAVVAQLRTMYAQDQFGFGYIAQQGSFSILRRLWAKSTSSKWMQRLANPFKSSTSLRHPTPPPHHHAPTHSQQVCAPPPFDAAAFVSLVQLVALFLFRWNPSDKKNTPDLLSFLTFYKLDGSSLVHTLWLFFQETYDVDAIAQMHDTGFPVPLGQVERVIVVFKGVLYRHYWLAKDRHSHPFGEYAVESATRLLQSLYNRCARRPFCNVTSWVVGDLDGDDVVERVLYDDQKAVALLQHMPYLLPYADRVRLFQALVKLDRDRYQENAPPCRMTIRRGYVLEDGLTKLNALRRDLKKKVQVHRYYILVHFINEAGTEEVGIDAGGLFKEFWTELSQLAFDPHYGLFQCSDVDHLLFPNPSSSLIHSNDVLLFEFLGRILGKALFENIVVQPKFSRFFLTKLLGNHNHIHDLPSLDPQLYK
ncbi:hypothetical protein DYB25_001454, partial [Aphanomyces astaci]